MRKIKNLVGLFSGFAAITANASNDIVSSDDDKKKFQFIDDVETAPLNTGEMPLYLAGHRSHSSHASHSSHRSSSGGTYKPRSTPTPAPRTAPVSPPSDPLGQPSRPKSTIPTAEESNFQKVMSDAEKRKNIILRVQLTLQALDFYHGKLDGIMGPETRKAVNKYRLSVGQTAKEKLDIEVLNSLGILVQ
ncbi:MULTISPECIES: His-Xaa-Ser repeat protein HxsA [unclassified Pseudoalteromonas]|uniref:His-Xaa-Ser repeat protein HxsA n=1 Tax=unclassified Pseudoalteromonas TaxID=194690 RepID=UPI00048B6D32|nr:MULTISPECIES: His-Xaa-Ser repeat protein HxsA [unclassified Pseudoalteromonas]